ncbi:MAG: right-handed parallel beta-helix repeat-containing protein [Candidatus Cloacimonetes bacterium]|nr:right-handed parallel beta-helix repeat-containing protein [Candidatus Cloacimonadota bacterium]
MKKGYLLFALLISLVTSIYCIDVSGNVSGEWTLEDSPYYVIGDIVVPAADSLIINPGVEVIFNTDIRLTVQGILKAIGSEVDSVKFTCDTEWDRIRLENETEMSYFEHCIIEKSQTAIHAIASPVSIVSSRIANTSDYGINIFGSTNQAETLIDNSKIHNTFKPGIHISQNSNTIISNCEITRCCATPSYMGAIHLQSQGSENNPTIINNHIHHNYKQGIIAWDVTSNSNINPYIMNNVIENNLTGIYLRHSSGVISGNIIRNNFVPGDANSGAGIMLAGSSCATNVLNNTITGNYTGFYIGENASPCLGDPTINTPTGNNVIMGNIDGSGNTNSIYLYSTNVDVNAMLNLFDSNDPEEIAETIYDSNDNSNLGTVNFDPFLQGSLVKGNITNLNPDRDYEIFITFISADNEVEYPWLFTENASWETVIEPGLYLVQVEVFEYFDTEDNSKKDSIKDFYSLHRKQSKDLSKNSRDSIRRLGFYGGFEEPTPLLITENDIIEDINIEVVDDFNYAEIEYQAVITHNNQELIPLVIYDPYFKYKSIVFYLFDNNEDDFVYAAGFRGINLMSGQWEDWFFEEATKFLKVRNVEINDQWNSILYDYAIVRDVNEEVIVDFMMQEEDVDKTHSRYFLTPNIGITQLKMYDINELNMKSNISISDAPTFEQPNNLLPLSENQVFVYDIIDIYSYDYPTSLALRDDGLFLWDAPAINLGYNEYRLYKDNQLYQVIDYNKMTFQVDSQDLPGIWYITAYSELDNIESLPSNEVIFTSITDETPSLTATHINLYPNPVNLNHIDKLSFSIQLSTSDIKNQNSNLKLEIFNIKGQKIKSFNAGMINIKNNKIEIPVTFLNKSSLSTGIYFYRLSTDSAKITKKFLLIK